MYLKLVFLTAILISQLSFASPFFEIKNQDQLIQYIQTSPFNGVVFVAKENNVLLKKAFGFKNIATKEPLAVTDLFQIGSNTKQFIALALLKLQEEGKLNLNDAISQYLPGFKKYGAITIRDVLNHTSGIVNYTDKQRFWEMFGDGTRVLSQDEILEFILDYELNFTPKTQWSYSNTGYIIAGRILEIVSGQTWDQYIKENFLFPLKMNQTGYNLYFNNVSAVVGHISVDDVLASIGNSNLSWAQSAGALYSNVDDLAKWLDIYEGDLIVSKKSIQDMQTPFLGNYGLGIGIRPFGNDIEIIHSGRTPGFVSSVSYLKKQKLKVITLDNVDGALRIKELLQNFYSKGSAQAIKVARYDVSEKDLFAYTGRYEIEGLFVDIYIENGKLFLKTSDGQPPYHLIANDLDCFHIGGMIGEEFIRNERDEVIGLKHYQNGGVTYFKRVPQDSIKRKRKITLQKSELFNLDLNREM